MILGMGVPELLVILVVVLVIFGPKNLPKLGSALGKTVKNVREGMDEGGDDKDKKADGAAAEDEDDADADADESATATAAKTTFCPKCGAENPAGNAFCSKCGAKLDSEK